MDKNTIIAVHGAHDPSGGVYNVLGSFSQGLLKGFKQNGIAAHSTVDCINNNIPFNITFGFNTSGLQVEKQLLKQGIPHVMWTVDSTFAHNFNSIYEFSNEPLFFLLEITSSDNDATSKFMPNLKHTFLPHATDLDVWKKQDIEKDYDIVFLSSIVDYEKKLQEIKERTNDKYFSLVMQMIEIGLKNQTLPFFEIYKIFQKHEGFEFNAPEYAALYQDVTYPLMYIRKIMLVNSLNDFNVKVFGSGPWEKYVSGKQQYCGSVNFTDSVSVINRAKICLHYQAEQIMYGLHERVLNASAVETFVLSNSSPFLKQEFSDAIAFSNEEFSDVAQLADYYVNNDAERIEKAKMARKIVEEKHTWRHRAASLIEFIN